MQLKTVSLTLLFLACTQMIGAQNPFVESDGLLIIEAESDFVESPGGWDKVGNNPTFLEAGSNHFGNTNGQTLTYDFVITTTGVYRLHMKSDITGSNTTESNDTWFKIENTPSVHYFCVEGGQLSGSNEFINILGGGTTNKTIYYPKGNAQGRPDHGNENPGNSAFFKIYRSGGGGNKWNARTIDHNGFPVYVYFPNAGTFTISISERSEGHKLDRFALAHLEDVGTGIPTSTLDGPESMRQNGCPMAGISCDDGDLSTFNDLTDSDCGCAGTPCPAAGTVCDDGDPNTINDMEDGFCNCIGTSANAQTLWLEAECAVIGNKWNVMNDNNASGGQYLSPPNSTSTGNAPNSASDIIKFIINISDPGSYKIYSRNVTSDDGDDSFWVRVNGGNWISWNKINYPYSNTNFTWNQVGSWTSGNNSTPLTFNLSSGLNEIEFSWREPGIKFDKLYVSKSGTPSGAGGASDNCADCEPNFVGSNILDGNISGIHLFQTNGQLESNQLVTGNNTNIRYKSPVSSTLDIGFETRIGAELLIFVEGCN